MRRFFIEKKSISNDTLVIKGKEAHHIKNVIRLTPNDKFIGFDAEGYQYLCKIKTLDRHMIEATIEEKKKSEIEIPDVTLACAIPRASKMDIIIQKASELRVKALIPMQTKRTEIKLNKNRAQGKLERWHKIAREASKQCGRDDVLKVLQPEGFMDIINNSGKHGLKLMPCLCDKARPIKEILRKITPSSALILIGPEGDFTQTEIDQAIKVGFTPVSLGQVVLRVDTAAIYTISALMYEIY